MYISKPFISNYSILYFPGFITKSLSCFFYLYDWSTLLSISSESLLSFS